MRQPGVALVDPLVSVVMPAYNERDTIEEIVRRVLAVPIRLELIVVDDRSTDGTRERLAGGFSASWGSRCCFSQRTAAKAAPYGLVSRRSAARSS